MTWKKIPKDGKFYLITQKWAHEEEAHLSSFCSSKAGVKGQITFLTNQVCIDAGLGSLHVICINLIDNTITDVTREFWSF